MVSSSLSIILSLPASSIPSNSTSDLYSTSNPLRSILEFKNNSKPIKTSPIFRLSLQQSSKILAFSSSNKSNNQDGSAEQFLENNSIADFMRFKKGSDRSSAELQTAVVSYKKRFPWSILYPFFQVHLSQSWLASTGFDVLGGLLYYLLLACVFFSLYIFLPVQVDLVSTIHIADKEYFETIQKELEPYDRVLYEMVASRESLESRRNPAAARRMKSSRSRGFNILGCIQRQMARILTLDFQLDYLDYQAENWYHADLDYETFKILQLEKGESFLTFARDMTLKSTKAMVQPAIPEDLGPWRSKLLWASRVLPMPLVGLFIIGTVCDMGSPASEYPELEALSRLDFGAAVKVFLAKRLTSEFTQVTADLEEESVIIGERNKAAVEALRRAINEGHNKIAILYGGGHMPDLGRRLREEFDLVPCGVQWITAWSIRNRVSNSNSLPFLRTMAEVLGWPLNRYQTLALLIFSSVLAIDLWFWELFFGSTVTWISQIASEVGQYVNNSRMIW
ncbi:hypothetical protein NC653_039720 [Populus alba x Populus x berolinensis]|uniref:Uncharacterized protein n=1 Tax=Populus alba x Populus x berolinensis TaxID=444605 RepID=A0AAD6LBX3_9ROSI|nr:hypothetical protein NC653_039720 [Populus alba x Populus x berolinensis]